MKADVWADEVWLCPDGFWTDEPPSMPGVGVAERYVRADLADAAVSDGSTVVGALLRALAKLDAIRAECERLRRVSGRPIR